MSGDTLMTIGELARLAGVLVKTVRFWSDEGLVPPADRTPSGYRRYGPDALTRLDLIRTLRDLGVGLSAIRKLLGDELMHKLAQLSAAQRRSLITEFIDDTFTGLPIDPGFEAMMRSAMPDLPDEPTQDQISAWVELAELVQDPDFRASLRRSASAQRAGRWSRVPGLAA